MPTPHGSFTVKRSIRSRIHATVSLGVDLDDYEVQLKLEPALDYNMAPAPKEKPKPAHRVGELIDRMRDIQRLSSLNVADLDLSPRDLQNIGQLSQLTWLLLCNAKLSDDQLAPLANLTKLRHLTIVDKGIRQPKALRSLPALEMLDLSGTSLDDEGLSALTPLRHTLRVLRLDRTGISDKSIAVLNEFKKLGILSASGAKISSAGVSQLNLSELLELEVHETELSKEIQEMLKKRMPRLSFIHDKRNATQPLPDAMPDARP